MSKTMKTLLTIVLTLFVSGAVQAQTDRGAPGATTVTFVFLPANDMFYIPWQGNDERLSALCRMVDTHRAAIDAGTLPVQVDSYCASLPTEKENLRMAFVRASRVKSELITRKGLKEADFVTANHARANLNNKDVVVVTLRIPSGDVLPDRTVPPADTVIPDRTVILNEVKDLQPQRSEPEILRSAQNDSGIPSAQNDSGTPSAQHDKGNDAPTSTPYTFALRTNLLYDALLLPTLGVEWRINPHVGVRLDGSLSHWGGSSDKVQKVWLLNPEVRWYLLRDKRFYAGVSATYGKYNIYKYPLGSLLKDDTGYQGSLWNAGLTVGYQLHLCRSFSLDFNLGLGYTRSEYDSFAMTNGTRVGKQRNKSKSLFGPTQIGVSLIWRLKKSKR